MCPTNIFWIYQFNANCFIKPPLFLGFLFIDFKSSLYLFLLLVCFWLVLYSSVYISIWINFVQSVSKIVSFTLISFITRAMCRSYENIFNQSDFFKPLAANISFRPATLALYLITNGHRTLQIFCVSVEINVTKMTVNLPQLSLSVSQLL